MATSLGESNAGTRDTIPIPKTKRGYSDAMEHTGLTSDILDTGPPLGIDNVRTSNAPQPTQPRQ